MRTKSIILWVILFVSPLDRGVAMQGGVVPRFSIEQTCREARAYASADKVLAYNSCLKDESDARDQLLRKWTSFRPADRSECVTQGATPVPSYVEVLTCLEMSADVETLNAPNGANGKKALNELLPY